ncbi:MAG: ATP-binding cassette domain-containing protein, partial [Candidatus Dormibacteria bacterium]
MEFDRGPCQSAAVDQRSVALRRIRDARQLTSTPAWLRRPWESTDVLALSEARIELGDRVLLEDATILIAQGEKVALVGANGMGKTTLLRAIAGDSLLTSGTVRIPPQSAYLRQDTPRLDGDHEQLAMEYLLEASPLTAVSREMDILTERMGETEGAELDDAIARFSDLQERFVREGGYEIEATAERIAGGVGLDEEALLTPVGALSGG